MGGRRKPLKRLDSAKEIKVNSLAFFWPGFAESAPIWLDLDFPLAAPGEFGRRAEPSVSRPIDGLAVGFRRSTRSSRPRGRAAASPAEGDQSWIRRHILAAFTRREPNSVLRHSGSASALAARPGRRSALPCAPVPAELPLAVPPGGRELVRHELRRADSGSSRSLAGNQGWPPHPHRSADRLGQDARGLPGGDRRTGAAGSRRAADRRNARRLRFPAQGAVERHPSQPRGPAGRHPGTAPPERASRGRNPHLGQDGRHAVGRARADAPPIRRTSS